MLRLTGHGAAQGMAEFGPDRPEFVNFGRKLAKFGRYLSKKRGRLGGRIWQHLARLGQLWTIGASVLAKRGPSLAKLGQKFGHLEFVMGHLWIAPQSPKFECLPGISTRCFPARRNGGRRFGAPGFWASGSCLAVRPGTRPFRPALAVGRGAEGARCVCVCV